MNGARVLVVVGEHDESLRARLRRLIERNRGRCIEAVSGAHGLRELFRTRPDIVLLDVSMPDSWRTLGRMRALTPDMPVLVLADDRGRLGGARGLRVGADDYLVKPFSQPELLVRMDVLLRRPRSAPLEPSRYGDELVEIDVVDAQAHVRGAPLGLTPLEFGLLAALVRRPGQVLSAEQLLALVWGDASLPRARVKLYVRYVREKFRAAGVDAPIQTLRGYGYRYMPPATPLTATVRAPAAAAHRRSVA